MPLSLKCSGRSYFWILDIAFKGPLLQPALLKMCPNGGTDSAIAILCRVHELKQVDFFAVLSCLCFVILSRLFSEKDLRMVEALDKHRPNLLVTLYDCTFLNR